MMMKQPEQGDIGVTVRHRLNPYLHHPITGTSVPKYTAIR